MEINDYRNLYELYLQKTDSELKEIIDPVNGYRETAIKVASDILLFGRITCEEALKKKGITDTTSVSEKKKLPTWLRVLALIGGLISLFVLLSGIWDLAYAISLPNVPDNKIIGNMYIGSGDYYGAIFYFYGENTYKFGTSSGRNILYGTYDLDGNALNLHYSNETLAAVIIDNGATIKIGKNELKKIADTEQMEHYKEIYDNINQE